MRKQFLKIAALFTALLASVGLGCSREQSQPLAGEPTIVQPQPQPVTGTPVPEIKGEIMGDVAMPPQTNNVSSCPAPQETVAPLMGKVAAPQAGAR